MFDVFLSYKRSDAEAVRRFAEALRYKGLEVWLDENRVEDFSSIQHAIEEGLARSKALVAWYSASYPESRACQWELTRAFTTAQREGDVRQRVLLINPEPANNHIHPVELRDALYQGAPKNPAELETTAEAVVRHVAKLTDAFESIRVTGKSPWFGAAKGDGSSRFFGRFAEFWEIHSGLWSSEFPAVHGVEARPLVRLCGMGGSGKSLAAEVYAIRFATAYPGGIFWLRAFGNEVQGSHTTDERAALLENQLIGFAQALGIPTSELKPGELRKKLTDALSQRGAYLWVVDDLGSGVSFAEARDWLAPGANGRTIVTTRATAFAWAGTAVRIEELNDEDALNLLTHARAPQDETEKAVARDLVHQLGNHALALELAAVAVQRRGFAGFRASLEDTSRDALDFAAELLAAQGETLPHRDSSNLHISATLLLSVRELSDAGRDFLVLAAQLAAVPIERQLVVKTLGRADELDDAAAQDSTDLAISAVLGRSLAREPATGHLLVHTLVSRAINFSAETAKRSGVLRDAAVFALDGILAEIVYEGKRPTTSEQVPELVAHAGAVLTGKLEKDAPMTMAEAQLIDTLYGFEIERGNFREARRIAERLLAFSIAQLGESHSNVFAYYNYLGRVLRMQGDFSGSLAAYERVVDYRRATLGAMHPDTIRIVSDMALTLYAQGDLKRSRALQEQVLDQRLKVLGTQHPDTQIAMNNLAGTLVTLGENAAAKELLDRTGGIPDQEIARTGDPQQGRIVRAEMLRSQHDFEGARALQEEILAERRQMLGEEHPGTLYALNNLAVTLNAQGDSRAARAMMSRVLELRTKVLGPAHLLTLATLRNLGAICLGQGDYDKAQEYLESALAKSLKELGREHFETLSAAYHLLLTLVRKDPSSARIGELMRNELAPLIKSDPATLPADFREIREGLLPLLQSANSASKTTRMPWWKRIF